MVPGFLRVISSGMLLLLATTTPMSDARTTTVAAMSEAGSTSVSPTGDDVTVCPTEGAACIDDATCLSCNSEISTTSTDFRECGEAIGLSDIESSTATCADYADVMCCVEEASELECLENDEFVAYWVCFFEFVGCGEEDVACDGDGGVDTAEGASNGATAVNVGRGLSAVVVVSSAFVLLLSA